MKLARTIRLDISDTNVFDHAAAAGEWAISGGFAFSNWQQGDLTGKAKQAFSNGWLGLDSFGRATLVAVAAIDDFERETLEWQLAAHFVKHYGAPDIGAALPVAQEEIAQMADLCAEHEDNTLLAISRELTEAGVRERYRAHKAGDAVLDQIATHGDRGD